MRSILIAISCLIFVGSCYSEASYNSITLPLSDINKVIVQEVRQASSYTYLRVRKDSLGMLLPDTLWIALPKIEATAGDTFYYKGGFIMTDFKSKDLNRTFSKITFLQKVSRNANLEEKMIQMPPSHISYLKNDSVKMPPSHTSYINNDSIRNTKAANIKLNIKIDTISGGTTIGELFANKALYSGTTVRVKGKVTKFTQKIMNKNWIHLQDGTEYEGKFDLTITTDEVVNMGDIIVLEGKISLDKSFGFGYDYKVMIEDAKLVK